MKTKKPTVQKIIATIIIVLESIFGFNAIENKTSNITYTNITINQETHYTIKNIDNK